MTQATGGAAAIQPEFFPGAALPDGWELLLSPARQRRVFSCERVSRNAERVEEIIRCVASGQSISAAARAYAVSRNTVARLIMLRPSLVEQLRSEAAAGFRVLSRMSVERLIESIDAIPLQVLPALAGIAIDKAQLLDGLPGQILHVKRETSDPARFDRWIDAQVIDVEDVDEPSKGVPGGAVSTASGPGDTLLDQPASPREPDTPSGVYPGPAARSELFQPPDAGPDASEPAASHQPRCVPAPAATTGGGGAFNRRGPSNVMDSRKRIIS